MIFECCHQNFGSIRYPNKICKRENQPTDPTRTKSINSPALVEDAVVGCAPISRIEITLLVSFVFMQLVLKWLHQPLSKNVMLWHPSVDSSHDFLHAARSETLLDDCIW